MTVGSRAVTVTSIGLDPSLSPLRLNCFPVSITLSVSVKFTLGGSAAAWLISGQRPLRPWLLLAVLLPTQCVCSCVCVYTSSAAESVYIRTLHLIFAPFEVHACVCEGSVSFPRRAVEMMARLSSARQPAACEVLARRPSSSPRLCQLPSLPLSARAQKSQFNVRLTFKRPFHRSPLPLAFTTASFFAANLRLKC